MRSHGGAQTHLGAAMQPFTRILCFGSGGAKHPAILNPWASVLYTNGSRWRDGRVSMRRLRPGQAVPCRAVPCCAVPCHPVLCHAASPVNATAVLSCCDKTPCRMRLNRNYGITERFLKSGVASTNGSQITVPMLSLINAVGRPSRRNSSRPIHILLLAVPACLDSARLGSATFTGL